MRETWADEFERRVSDLEGATVSNVLRLLVEVGENGMGGEDLDSEPLVFSLLLRVVEVGKSEDGEELVERCLQMLRAGVREIHSEEVIDGTMLGEFAANRWLIQALGSLQDRDWKVGGVLVSALAENQQERTLRMRKGGGFEAAPMGVDELVGRAA